MGKFIVRRKLELDSIGEDWNGCYVELADPGTKLIQDLTKIDDTDKDLAFKQSTDLIKTLFISGRGFNGEEVVDISKEDLDDLPISVYREILSFLLQPQTLLKSTNE